MWHYMFRGQPQGPVDEEALGALLKDRVIDGRTYVWKEDMPKWERLSKTELMSLMLSSLSAVPYGKAGAQPPAIPTSGTYQPYNARTMKPAAVRIRALNHLFIAYFIFVVVGYIINTLGFITPTYAIGTLILLSAAVLEYILLYRYWETIQDGYARTTPGKAIGYLFIPFYDFYWFFQALPGLSKDMNAYIIRYQIPTEQLHVGIALAIPILLFSTLVVSYIPNIGSLLGIIVGLANYILLVLSFYQWKNIASIIIEHQEQTQAQ